ncbi:MAG: response regulator [Deltaproteobacteria bacterium]|nr:response regulator [Deltaproteobacteria bacterium]
MAREKVLLVDDELEFTQVLSKRMRSRGVDVDTAASGREALEKVRGKSYDAIILDLSMPEMDGIETLRHLIEDNPDLQVILLTGYGTLQEGIEAIKLGAMDFLEKPAKIQKLIETIEEAKANKMLLVEKRVEQRIKGILETKSW